MEKNCLVCNYQGLYEAPYIEVYPLTKYVLVADFSTDLMMMEFTTMRNHIECGETFG